MDPISNPFAPGAGTPPPELAGRESIMQDVRVLLERTRVGRSEKSMLLTGLRGVGKTVLLNELERLAGYKGYRTIPMEAHEGKPLELLLVPQLRRVLFELDRIAGTGHKVRRALAVLRSFIGGIRIKVGEVDFGLDIEPETGSADSGDLEVDLPNLFQAVAEAAKERGVGVALLIDEIQYFTPRELSALIMAMHRLQQRQLPLVLIGAGLPILPALAGESKSYAERLFNFPSIGPLSEADAFLAIRNPIRDSGAEIETAALHEIFRLTMGYPYFLQEWGYQAWNLADAPPITMEVIQRANGVVARRLDDNFFRVRFDRLTPREKRCLRAMAELGPGPHRTGDVADGMGILIHAMAPVRASLIKKGMAYSPAHGEMAFTVPLFDEFLRRIMPLNESAS